MLTRADTKNPETCFGLMNICFDVYYSNAVLYCNTSRLDYANSLLKGSPGKEISHLQGLQNRAVKLIFMAKKSDHVSPLLEQLHRLPVHKRIDFKTLTIIFKCYSDYTPS